MLYIMHKNREIVTYNPDTLMYHSPIRPSRNFGVRPQEPRPGQTHTPTALAIFLIVIFPAFFFLLSCCIYFVERFIFCVLARHGTCCCWFGMQCDFLICCICEIWEKREAYVDGHSKKYDFASVLICETVWARQLMVKSILCFWFNTYMSEEYGGLRVPLHSVCNVCFYARS